MEDRAESRDDRRRAVLLFGFFVAVFLLFQEGGISGSDGDSMYEVTSSLVDHRDVDVSESAGIPGVDGKHYSIYGIGLSLLGVPLYALSKIAAAIVGHDDYVGRFFVATVLPLVVAAIAPAVYLLARRLGVDAQFALVAAVAAV